MYLYNSAKFVTTVYCVRRFLQAYFANQKIMA